MKYISPPILVSLLNSLSLTATLSTAAFAESPISSAQPQTDILFAFIKGNSLIVGPKEIVDDAQSNNNVTVIKQPNGSVHVFYHDPKAGNKLVKREVLPGGHIDVSYWNANGDLVHQDVYAGTPRSSSSPPRSQTSTVSSETKSSQETASSTPPSEPTPTSSTESSPAETTPSATSPIAPTTAEVSPPSTPIASIAPVTSKRSSNPPQLKALPAAKLDHSSPGTAATSEQSTTTAPSDQVDDSDNYIAALAGPSGLRHWNQNKFPLKVYIAPGNTVSGYQEDFRSAVEQAFADWTKSSNEKMTFKFQDTPTSADIIVRWTANANDLLPASQAGKKQFVLQEAGQARVRNWQGIIDHSDIYILTTSPSSAYERSYKSVHTVALHEIGHSLGLIGHSPDPSDVMYSTVAHQQLPTRRDIATLNVLYKSTAKAAFPTTAEQSVQPADVFGSP